MPACSNFTPDVFRPTRCCECFLIESDHSNDSILSVILINSSNETKHSDWRSIENFGHPKWVVVLLLLCRESLSPNSKCWASDLTLASPLRPVVANSTPSPSVVPNSTSPRPVVPNPRPSLSAVPNRTPPASTIQNQPPPQSVPLGKWIEVESETEWRNFIHSRPRITWNPQVLELKV